MFNISDIKSIFCCCSFRLSLAIFLIISLVLFKCENIISFVRLQFSIKQVINSSRLRFLDPDVDGYEEDIAGDREGDGACVCVTWSIDCGEAIVCECGLYSVGVEGRGVSIANISGDCRGDGGGDDDDDVSGGGCSADGADNAGDDDGSGISFLPAKNSNRLVIGGFQI